MYKSAKLRIKPLIISLLISLGTGFLSGIFTKGSSNFYETITKPPLAPPGYIFPLVWSILFALMGISSYIIFISDSPKKKQALTVYFIQLIVNFIWPIIFFNERLFLVSFLWILLLWVLIFIMIILFRRINKTAGNLQIPYFLWVTFAAYLNFMIFILNR